MPFSCFSKEIQDYTRACEHLIGESVKRTNQFNRFSEEELQLVRCYTDEVVRLLEESMKGPQLAGRSYQTPQPNT
jgi:hypothetical protein